MIETETRSDKIIFMSSALVPSMLARVPIVYGGNASDNRRFIIFLMVWSDRYSEGISGDCAA